MFSLGAITFLSPWLLAPLALVPVLWWLLRVLPPRPKTVRFPAFFLLQGLETKAQTTVHTPWWLLLLRMAIVILFILAMADPVLRAGASLPGNKNSAVLLVIDNGWAAAAGWQERVARMDDVLSQAKRDGRPVFLVPTAPSPTEGKINPAGAMDAEEAAQQVKLMKPYPWPSDRAAAGAIVRELAEKNKIGHTLFFSDGTTNADMEDFLTALQTGGGLTAVMDDDVNRPFILRHSENKAQRLSFTLETLKPLAASRPLRLIAYGAEGNVLDEHAFVYPSGQKNADVAWDIPDDLLSGIARVGLASPAMAAAVYLTDRQWRRHPAGILADASRRENKSFLNEVYYLQRALAGAGSLTVDGLDALVDKKLSVLIWPDSAALTAVERVSLLDWVEKGGFLIRFAGANLAGSPDDPLLPVSLRYGQRAMQGAMTWEKPLHLAAIPPESPLFGLEVPKDVTVTRQVLAEPSPEVFERTWLQLEDGTPLVTGGAIGRGMVVMVHTTAGPEWSNFCYSGLYVEALQRMISLSTGIAGYKAETVLPPAQVMDAFGRLQAAGSSGFISAIDPKQPYIASPRTPPGIYGDAAAFHVANLGESLPALQALSNLPAGAETMGYSLSGEKKIRPDLLRAALFLLLLDTLAMFFLRGLFSMTSFRRAGAVAVLLSLFFAQPALAQAESEDDLVTGLYLAYVETGDQMTDSVSYNGLMGLRSVINARTNIKVAGVRSVDPSSEALFYYPFLYWPMAESQQALSLSAARNIQDYMAQGGMILFDTRDQQFAGGSGETAGATPGTVRLRQLMQNIRIAELMPVEQGHILTKSFYLLDDFPGAQAGGRLWAEKEPNQGHDAVTSVVIGGNDWAAAWSNDPQDRARFRITPGGEKQREMAYRFGVNLAMVALAGNYKADQVHVPYILERIGQ